MGKTTKRSTKKAMPLLAAALICERLLQETDNVLTVMRIVDTITLSRNQPPEVGAVLAMPLTMLVSFKVGEARGKQKLKVIGVSPSNKREEIGAGAVRLSPGIPESGVNFNFPVRLRWEREGLYWFEITMDGTRVARIPLRVRLPKTVQ